MFVGFCIACAKLVRMAKEDAQTLCIMPSHQASARGILLTLGSSQNLWRVFACSVQNNLMTLRGG